MSEIPEDIRDRAEAVYAAWGWEGGIKELIARAIMDEREACAQIAANACDRHGFWQDGEEIAAAIRSPK